jgi:hypothetical protein
LAATSPRGSKSFRNSAFANRESYVSRPRDLRLLGLPARRRRLVPRVANRPQGVLCMRRNARSEAWDISLAQTRALRGEFNVNVGNRMMEKSLCAPDWSPRLRHPPSGRPSSGCHCDLTHVG